jgi:hypothetical protein
VPFGYGADTAQSLNEMKGVYVTADEIALIALVCEDSFQQAASVFDQI